MRNNGHCFDYLAALLLLSGGSGASRRGIVGAAPGVKLPAGARSALPA